MPKSYTVGNGSMLVGFDEHAQVRDLYFPYVGQENHVGDQLRHRLAVRVDGETHFVADDFDVQTVCSADTLAGKAKAVNEESIPPGTRDNELTTTRTVVVQNYRSESASRFRRGRIGRIVHPDKSAGYRFFIQGRELAVGRCQMDRYSQLATAKHHPQRSLD